MKLAGRRRTRLVPWRTGVTVGLAIAFACVPASPSGGSTQPLPPCCGGSGCCGFGGGPPNPCTLTYGAAGTVRDGVTGLPIAGATIRVLDLPAVTTGADGMFSVSGSREETCNIDYYFSITVSAPGYRDYQDTLYTSAVFSSRDVELDPLGGVRVAGFVAEVPPCSGRMRGVAVVLEPLGVSSRTSTGPIGGEFAFDNLPPGTYTLTVPSGCNPVGCWRDTPVEVGHRDVRANVCMDELPSPTVTPRANPTPCALGDPQCPPDWCAGDCDGDGRVVIAEMILGVRIALGRSAFADCPAIDADGDGSAEVSELVQSVANGLDGCPRSRCRRPRQARSRRRHPHHEGVRQ